MTGFFGEVDGTDFDIFDRRFADRFVGQARVGRLWSGARWSVRP